MEYFENKFSVTYISLYNHFSKLSDSCKKVIWVYEHLSGEIPWIKMNLIMWVKYSYMPIFNWTC